MIFSKRFLLVLVAACAALITGCTTPPSAAELASLDYGSAPTDYKKSIERYLDSTLKDPDSKKVEYISTPVTQWYKANPMYGGNLMAGYAVCAYVNAKNSYGGYTGGKLSWFLIKNDRVTLAFISSTRDSFETVQAERACKRG